MTSRTPSKRKAEEEAEPGAEPPAPAPPPEERAAPGGAAEEQQLPSLAQPPPPRPPPPAAPAAPAPPVDAAAKRLEQEQWLIKQETDGDLRFLVIQNDRVEQHSIWLVDLKNIYAKQLPNMPKDYIVRLVFDQSHKSLIAVKEGAVLGGITYRLFSRQALAEIAFCAVSSSEQVKGYGSRLMSKLKTHARDAEGVTHLITFADNNAVGYFSKLGFSKEILLEREKWSGYIKEYDGGTLMESLLHPPARALPADFGAAIRGQRGAVEAKIKELTCSHVVHPGLSHFRDAPPRPGATRPPLPVASIPGLAAAGWTPAPLRFRLVAPGCGSGAPTRENLHRFMKGVHVSVLDHPDGWPFAEPVDGEEVSDYYDIVKEPVDLRMIGERLELGDYYVTLEVFAADFRRMFHNCRLYNAPDTPYFKCANRLEAFFDQRVAAGITWTKRS